MSLKLFDRLRNSTGVRLTLWYAALGLLHTLVLSGLTYVLLASSLQQRDWQHIAMEIQEIVELYRASGAAGVQQEVNSYGHPSYYFVRLVGADQKTLVLSLPEPWIVSTLPSLDTMRVPETMAWGEIRTGDDNRLDVASLGFPDGAVLQVGKTATGRTALLTRFRVIVVLVMLPMIALSMVGGWIMAVRTLRPLRSLIQTVQSIEAGALDTRVAISQTGYELDELGRLFNQMLDRIAMLIHGMRDTLDNVAHDIRTPMARLRASAEIALQVEDPTHAREALADCLEESERLLTMLHTLMDISEAETGMMSLALEPFTLAEVLAEVANIYRYVIEDRALSVSIIAPPTLEVVADRMRLQQVLANLLDNAVKYTPPKGHITLTAFQEPGGVAVAVEDTGHGMTPEELTRIWDRLYRGDTSRSHRGLGLGLSLVKAIVQAHHGTVAVSSRQGMGSRFTLRFSQTPSSHC